MDVSCYYKPLWCCSTVLRCLCTILLIRFLRSLDLAAERVCTCNRKAGNTYREKGVANEYLRLPKHRDECSGDVEDTRTGLATV
jgi:hypothetical protein